MIGDDFGKNSLPKTSAAIVPYSRKSYRSIVVPTVLAITARRTARDVRQRTRASGDYC